MSNCVRREQGERWESEEEGGRNENKLGEGSEERGHRVYI